MWTSFDQMLTEIKDYTDLTKCTVEPCISGTNLHFGFKTELNNYIRLWQVPYGTPISESLKSILRTKNGYEKIANYLQDSEPLNNVW